MNIHELVLLLTAKDGASATLKTVARILTTELVVGLGEAAQAAARDEASTARLAQAVMNAGKSYDELQPQLEERIKLGQQLAFTDDDTRAALSDLIVLTKDAGKALDLESLAMDIARAKSMDLEQATRLVERTYNGNAAAGERYGFVIRENSTATQALAQLQQQAAGQAETYAATNAAGIDRMKDAIAEWKEGIGAALGPAGQFIALLPGFATGIAGIATVLGFAGPAMKAFFLWIKADAIPTLLALDVAIAPLLALLAVGGAIGLVGANLLTGHEAFDVSGLPGFDQGGVVPGAMGAPQLAVVHGGEEILRPDQHSSRSGEIHVHFEGPVYGMNDFENQVGLAVRNVKERGGLRGVVA